jgi:VWFA-related protein
MTISALRTQRHTSLLTAIAIAIAAALPAQTPVQPEYTIQARVPLTYVDIVVTDAQGHPVHGLKQSDFTLLEDNHPMMSNSFEEHRTDQVPPAASPLQAVKLPPNTFTNIAPAPTAGSPINVLLIDNLNTPTQVQQRVQLEMLNYVKRMPAGTRFIVLGLTYRLFILQGVTSDPERINAAITDKKSLYLAPPLEDLKQDPMGPDLSTVPEPPEADCNRMALRGQYTLTAMHQLARYLSGIAGRKNLIWFGGSFPPKWSPDIGDCYDFTQPLNQATDQLARARIAIYTVESRGLQKDNRLLLEEDYNMQLRADQTGGKAFFHTNDLAGSIANAVNTGSNFYTLTYTPTNQTLDTHFRTITVKVSQPNLHLSYRPGYYAIDPASPAGKKVDAVTPMQSAMMRGGLEPTQIQFSVRVTQSPNTETSVPADNKPNSKQMKPPYRRYSLAYTIDIHGIQFDQSPDGNYRANFEYTAMLYNADGDAVLNSTSKSINPVLPPAVYRSMLQGGAHARQEIDLPAIGDYFLRIGVHDLASDHVGAIEIPTTSLTSTN